MQNKKYFFDFYECLTRNSDAHATLRTTADMLNIAFGRKAAGNSTVKEIAGRSYEFRELEQTTFGYKGIIGKHRDSDLPHAAVIDGEERD